MNYRVRMVGGPRDGTETETPFLGKWLRYPEDEQDGGRYVWESSREGEVAVYVWEEEAA